jgi:hypothetical protein
MRNKIFKFSLLLFSIASILIAIIAIGFPLLTTPKSYGFAQIQTWWPNKPRQVPTKHPVIPDSSHFHGFHTDLRNSNEILRAVAPTAELDWSVETKFFIPDGSSIDKAGNVYFSPVSPKENVVLVSIDGETGDRRWAIPGEMSDGLTTRGSGGPPILNEPVRPGEQIIYLGLYDRAIAVRPDGTVLWDLATGMPVPRRAENMKFDWHNYGRNYLPKHDALVSLLSSGHMDILDRKTGRPLLAKPFKVREVLRPHQLEAALLNG